MADAPIRTALVGCGAWGRNLLREIAASRDAEIVAVVDPSEEAHARARSIAPDVKIVRALGDAFALDIDAVVIASPPPLHAEHALDALRAGKHVMVEKPLTTDSASAESLVREAARRERIAMVGHLMRYHPGIERLLEVVRSGALGAVRYGSSARLSSRRSEGSVVWALAPHDLSLWRAVTAAPLLHAEVESLGDDIAFMRVRSETGLVCQVELSRAHAFRERRFTVVFERGVAIFDDGGERPTLSVCRRSVPDLDDIGSFETFLKRHRRELHELPLPPDQPLTLELAHFFTCIRTGQLPRTGFDEGAEVVRVLARALATPPPKSLAHG